MSKYDYSLFVIGGGSGGVRAARIASGNYGASVGIAEEYRYGGTCVIRGCVPKKLFVYASHYAHDFADAEGFGWSFPGKPSHSWSDLIAAKDKEIDRLNGIYKRLLDNAGVEMFDGRATLVDAHTVDIAGKRVTADKILIATGAAPFYPDTPGIEHAISSNEAFHLPELGQRIAVIGGGYVACEFAGIFAGLGRTVTQIYRRDQVLRGFDDDLRDMVAEGMRGHGVDIRTNEDVEAIEKTGDTFRLTLKTGGSLDVDVVMYATGRPPASRNMGLEQVGVELGNNGAIVVDEFSRTSVDNIYAVGDVTDRAALTPIAIAEGQAFADTVFGDKPSPINHDQIPTAVFSQPSAASVGLTETEARESLGDVDIYKSRFRPMKHTLSGREEKMLMKLVVDPSTDKVLGAHVVGDDAAEIIQAIAVAVRMGASKADFDRTIAIHPTAGEEFVLMRNKWTPPADG